ncbi:FxDxF family PEP-CTERM protein [Massilia rhizosphaerae]|uniref:FxDxF family PEP-CTERM protein n=1 Tax=Massilia rhizosphaerae TaxID=2784389 RepID=UPI0018DCAACB|nr:FxDxF family PEP-CTERM protein [Massilia rhizosphaerae]
MKLKFLVLAMAAGAALVAQGADAATVDRTAPIVTVDDGLGGFNAHFGDTFAQSTTGSTFTDIFTFDVGTPFDAAASLTSSYLDTPQTKDLLITGLSLYRYDPVTKAMLGTAIAGLNGTGVDPGAPDSWSLAGYGLTRGSYAIQVNGQVRGAGGGAFGADLTISPVPEPQTWGMLLAGLGVCSTLAWRRRQSARVRADDGRIRRRA